MVGQGVHLIGAWAGRSFMQALRVGGQVTGYSVQVLVQQHKQ